MARGWQVVRLQEQDVVAAGAAMARGFADDPLSVYMYPDATERTRCLPWLYTVGVHTGLIVGEVYTNVGQIAGAAVWRAPAAVSLTDTQRSHIGLDQTHAMLGVAPYQRYSDVFDYLDGVHQQAITNPHWYLMILAVDQSRQGQGLGAALLAPILAQADATHTPCYVETFSPRTVRFYQRQGFHILIADTEPQSGLHFWALRREPLVQCSLVPNEVLYSQ